MARLETMDDAHASPRRRWASAALRSGALLVVPFAVWLALPAPPAPPPARPTDAPRRDEARATAVTTVASPSPRLAAPAPSTMPAAVREPEALEGDVQDPDGKPVAGALVTCKVDGGEITANTDEAGRFRLVDEASSCRAIASKRGFKPSEEEVVSRGATNRLRLRRATGIAGHVVDDTGMPIMNFIVGVEPVGSSAHLDAGALASMRRPVDDPEGAFELIDLEPGRYDVVVSVPRGAFGRTPGVDVKRDALTSGVRVALGNGVTVTGTVTDAATHAPIDGVRVFVLMGGLVGYPAWTRNGGHYTLEHAPEEAFDLRMLAPGYRFKIVPGLKGTSAQPLQVDAALERGADKAPAGH